MLHRFEISIGIFLGFAGISFASAQVPDGHIKAETERLAIHGHSILVDNPSDSARKKMYEVQLICPDANNGSLVLVSRNLNQIMVKYQIEYRMGKALYLRLFADKNKGEGLELVIDLDINSTDPQEKKLGALLLKEGNETFETICIGTQESRSNYRSQLVANRKLLNVSEADYPSDF